MKNMWRPWVSLVNEIPWEHSFSYFYDHVFQEGSPYGLLEALAFRVANYHPSRGRQRGKLACALQAFFLRQDPARVACMYCGKIFPELRCPSQVSRGLSSVMIMNGKDYESVLQERYAAFLKLYESEYGYRREDYEG